ncbi:unnamed protein product [Musa acuminata subsp. malaccensis]|uniref:(wild Malaysian banana) hypothetical protein n=1 Tax=Musa acuminata subsp. malaccensis TaxID=214687 RepID=A0A804I0U9_MUSAM|nr:unnamed protein product [Musa acuminata subsp. malaccensis]
MEEVPSMRIAAGKEGTEEAAGDTVVPPMVATETINLSVKMARLTSDETEKGQTGKILITLSISNYVSRYQDTNIKGTKPHWGRKKCFSASLISLRWFRDI